MRVFGFVLILCVGLFTVESHAAEQRFVSIGTGGLTGVYYPAGGAICRFLNKDRSGHGVRCLVEATGGSLDNLAGLESGELAFGIVQSDVQANAYLGQARWKDTAFRTLRAVFSIHAEPVTMLAREGSNIHGLGDLTGKKVNIGNPGSGQYATWEIMESEGLVARKELAEVTELKSSAVGQALCDGRIDSYFWLVGHPSALTQETISSCDARLVPIAGEAVDNLLLKYPYYRKAKIPAGMYNNEDDINTFGVGAIVVTTDNIPEDVVYTVVKTVFENIDNFRRLHPAFGQLDEQEMIRDSLIAPLHPGALKYYMERGWL